jgi:hypothetical protein
MMIKRTIKQPAGKGSISIETATAARQARLSKSVDGKARRGATRYRCGPIEEAYCERAPEKQAHPRQKDSKHGKTAKAPTYRA